MRTSVRTSGMWLRPPVMQGVLTVKVWAPMFLLLGTVDCSVVAYHPFG